MTTFKKIVNYFRSNPIFIIGFLLAIGLIYRGLFISYNPIGHDEPFSIFHAQMSLVEIITALKGGNNPPLYELFLHFWIKVFGINPVSVRIPSLIFSTLNIYFVFLLGNRFFNLRVAILATLLIIFSSYHIYFSHEARVYSLFSLLTTISFFLLFQVVSKERKSINYLYLLCTYLAMIYAHYLGIVVISLHFGIVIFYNYRNIKLIRKYIFVILMFLLIISFSIPEIFRRVQDFQQNGTWLEPVENLGNLHHMVFVFANKSKFIYLIFMALFWFAAWISFFKTEINKYVRKVILFVIIPVSFLISYSIFFSIPFLWKVSSTKATILSFLIVTLSGFIYLILKNKKKNQGGSIIAIWFIAPFFLLFVISFIHPLFHDRYLVFMISALYLGIAIIIEQYFKKSYFYIVSGVLILLMIITVDLHRNDNIGIDKTINTVSSLKTNTTKILICPPEYKQTFAYHYDKQIFSDYRNIDKGLSSNEIYTLTNANNLNKILDSTSRHILFIDAHSKFLYPNNRILDSLKIKYKIKEKFEYKDSLVVYNLNLKQL